MQPGEFLRPPFQFVVAGGITLAILIAPTQFVDRAVAMQFAPFRIVVFSLIIAYGIATRKIMDVGFFFRRVTSYAVLTAYLLVLYALVWWLVSTASKPIFPTESRTAGHLESAQVYRRTLNRAALARKSGQRS